MALARLQRQKEAEEKKKRELGFKILKPGDAIYFPKQYVPMHAFLCMCMCMCMCMFMCLCLYLCLHIHDCVSLLFPILSLYVWPSLYLPLERRTKPTLPLLFYPLTVAPLSSVPSLLFLNIDTTHSQCTTLATWRTALCSTTVTTEGSPSTSSWAAGMSFLGWSRCAVCSARAVRVPTCVCVCLYSIYLCFYLCLCGGLYVSDPLPPLFPPFPKHVFTHVHAHVHICHDMI